VRGAGALRGGDCQGRRHDSAPVSRGGVAKTGPCTWISRPPLFRGPQPTGNPRAGPLPFPAARSRGLRNPRNFLLRARRPGPTPGGQSMYRTRSGRRLTAPFPALPRGSQVFGGGGRALASDTAPRRPDRRGRPHWRGERAEARGGGPAQAEGQAGSGGGHRSAGEPPGRERRARRASP